MLQKVDPRNKDIYVCINNTLFHRDKAKISVFDSVVQGGDGGMEYAMLTFITGGRDFVGLLGVTSHELAHSWFQHVLATNEMKHEWMDEGFASYISALAKNAINVEAIDYSPKAIKIINQKVKANNLNNFL